jgi:large subunit ribosomal protein L20
MVRIKHAVSTRRRKRRLLKRAQGQFGQRHRRYQQAKRSLMKSMTYAYRDRRLKKREFRNLWVVRINAACREQGLSYSRFMSGLTKAQVAINRKVLADLAVNSPVAFKRLVKLAKDSNETRLAEKSPSPNGQAKE